MNLHGNGCGYIGVPNPTAGDGKATYEYDTKGRSIRDKGDIVKIKFEDIEGRANYTIEGLVTIVDSACLTVRQTNTGAD